MTIRPEAIRDRLRRLRQAIGNLDVVRKVPRPEFLASFKNYWLAERGLQLAAEILFDIGNHILAGHFNVHPTDYEDVVRRLAIQRVVSAQLEERLRGLGGFRNVLVHGYLDIDEGRVYDQLQGGLDVFATFADEIDAFLEAVRDSHAD